MLFRSEERLEEQSRIMRQIDRQPGEDVFEQVGISAEDASLIAERLISHVAQLERQELEASKESESDQASLEEADQADPETVDED